MRGMEWSAVLNLVGVALGGGIAALAGSRSSRRGAAADALTALAEMHDMRREPGSADREVLLSARVRLLAAGCSWVLVEMHERATLASRTSASAIVALREAAVTPEQQKYASRMYHPSRFYSRPLLQLGDVFEQALAEQIERPIKSKLLAAVRLQQLKRLTRGVRADNASTDGSGGAGGEDDRDRGASSHAAGLAEAPNSAHRL
jgi:hypothetical protein